MHIYDHPYDLPMNIRIVDRKTFWWYLHCVVCSPTEFPEIPHSRDAPMHSP